MIIGKSGYVAHALAAYLDGQGHKVRAVGSDECDFRDKDSVRSFFSTLEPDLWTVVVTAAVGRLVANDHRSFLDNLAISRNCATYLPQDLVHKLIFLSSTDVYGLTPPIPLVEDSPIAVHDPYGLSKYVSERIFMDKFSASLPLAILRLPGVYGKGFADRSVVARFAHFMKEGRTVTLSAQGQPLRDFIHVEDLCCFIEQFSTSSVEGVFNVATGVSFSMKDIAFGLADALDCRSLVLLDKTNTPRDFDLVFDTRKIKTLFPQFKFRPLSEGLLPYCQAAVVTP